MQPIILTTYLFRMRYVCNYIDILQELCLTLRPSGTAGLLAAMFYGKLDIFTAPPYNTLTRQENNLNG